MRVPSYDRTFERSLLVFGGLKMVWSVSLIIFGAICELSSYSQVAEKGNNHPSADRSLSSTSVERALAEAKSAALERHYSTAIKILVATLHEHPGSAALQLE